MNARNAARSTAISVAEPAVASDALTAVQRMNAKREGAMLDDRMTRTK